MKILLLSGLPHHSGRMGISLYRILFWSFVVVAGMAAGGIWYGYQLGLEAAQAAWREEAAMRIDAHLQEQMSNIEENRKRTNENLDALAMRLGEIQSHMLRVNALGERLVEMEKLDLSEFDFAGTPALGGPESPTARSVDLQGLLEEMEELSRVIGDRERKLGLLEDLMINRNIQQEIRPTGLPVEGGWISSSYGFRKDPFTGKTSFHDGVDITTARDNAKVTAVASGVVIRTGYADGYSGYGKLVEVKHGNGYVTRYAHNADVFVKPGDLVTRGQVIATMGSTGRSTGDHVHFEVAHNGKNIDPTAYLRDVN
jgi:murein DD-endopeptidase MepM/ murein hydrolase activator NlpD